MTLSAEYLLLGAAVLGGAGLLLDEAKQSTKQLGDNFNQQVTRVGKMNPVPKQAKQPQEERRDVSFTDELTP